MDQLRKQLLMGVIVRARRQLEGCYQGTSQTLRAEQEEGNRRKEETEKGKEEPTSALSLYWLPLPKMQKESARQEMDFTVIRADVNRIG